MWVAPQWSQFVCGTHVTCERLGRQLIDHARSGAALKRTTDGGTAHTRDHEDHISLIEEHVTRRAATPK
jgi:hypothetical protein